MVFLPFSPHQLIGLSDMSRNNLERDVKLNQRTGPVNAHLRSAVYTNVIENSPSIGAGEALEPLFFQNNQYTVYTFPSNDILTVYPFKYIGNPC